MSELEQFGNMIAEDLRDAALNRYLDIESGHVGSETAKKLNMEVSELTEDQKILVRKLITHCVDVGIHDFLFALEEGRNNIKVLVNETNVSEVSDGLQGEIYTADGWFEKYSQHKENGL
ncbi:MAG: hypothetical protein OEZ58_06620 [Gammaproteobacteria bacterium]|nr:hypothetical protein [Gammaproteobacteria bacterium]